MQNLLKVLELDHQSEVTWRDVKQASRRLILKYHPDVNPRQKQWAETKVKEVLTAYHDAEIQFKTVDKIYFKPIETFPKQQPPFSSDMEDSELDLFLFSIGKVRFSLPVHITREILRYSDNLGITACFLGLRHHFNAVIGIFNHRGDCVPLVDLAEKLHWESTVPATLRHVVIVDYRNQRIGLLVDQGVGLMKIKQGAYTAVSSEKFTLSHFSTIYGNGNHEKICHLNLDDLFVE